jgi:hypothetical protein
MPDFHDRTVTPKRTVESKGGVCKQPGEFSDIGR